MPVRARVLCLLAVAAALVVAMLQDVRPDVVTVLAATLAAVAPAAISRSGGKRCDHGRD